MRGRCRGNRASAAGGNASPVVNRGSRSRVALMRLACPGPAMPTSSWYTPIQGSHAFMPQTPLCWLGCVRAQGAHLAGTAVAEAGLQPLGDMRGPGPPQSSATAAAAGARQLSHAGRPTDPGKIRGADIAAWRHHDSIVPASQRAQQRLHLHRPMWTAAGLGALAGAVKLRSAQATGPGGTPRRRPGADVPARVSLTAKWAA